MRIAIGLLMIGLALFAGYEVLIGRFPPSQANAPVPPVPSSGGPPSPVPPGATGSGGVSWAGRLSHLGIPTLPLSGDMGASRGGMR